MNDELIPYDKSWLMRLGVLDLLNGFRGIEKFVENHDGLGEDIEALARASKQWRENQPIDVGESGTLYRFLQFAAWARGEDRKFIKHGTLKDRKMVSDPSIVDLSLDELLKLDNGTSQWASASVLLGSKQKSSQMPYKLGLTYEALEHWEQAKNSNKPWVARKDQTIANQAKAYKQWLETGRMEFTPEQSEDYCFARAFDLITAEEGEKRWPSLRQHESDRIESMEIALKQKIVDSADHRVVQAVAMLKGDKVKFAHPECVSKTWPNFWQFLKEVKSDTINS